MTNLSMAINSVLGGDFLVNNNYPVPTMWSYIASSFSLEALLLLVKTKNPIINKTKTTPTINPIIALLFINK